VNVNVHINESNDKPADTLYAIISDFKLQKIGLGTIDPAGMTVTVVSYDVLNGLADGSVDALDAYTSGQVTITGGGFVDKLKYKVLSWVTKYGYRK
jgi:putative sterol carrier protein